jgi:C4-dicarboxylate transporter DctM subunit
MPDKKDTTVMPSQIDVHAELPAETGREPQDSAPVRYAGMAAGWTVIAIAIAILYEVLGRLFFDRGTNWVFEVSGYALIWFTFLSGGFALGRHRHIHVEILADRLTQRSQLFLRVAGLVLIWCYLAVLLFFTLETTFAAFETGERSPTPARVPMALVYVIMAIGLVFFLYQASISLIRDARELAKSSGPINAKSLAAFAVVVAGGIVAWSFSPPTGLLILLFALLFAGLPVFAVLGTVGSFGLFMVQGLDIGLGQSALLAFKATDSYTLLAIPLFILAGIVLQRGGIGADLYRLATTGLGGVRGGLGIATVLACGVFAAISGSSVATAAAIGLIAIPEMVRRGYQPRKVYGLMAAGGTLGILIPPSTAMILYSSLTNVSTGQLFMGGVVPGILLMVLFGIFVYFTTDRKSTTTPKSTRAETNQALLRGGPALALPVIVLGGIYLGIFTATEAAAVALVYAVVLSLVQKRLKVKEIPSVIAEGTLSSGMIMMIIVGAITLGGVITYLRIPNMVVSAVEESGLSVMWVMVLIVLGYIILGMFLEVVSIMLITLPIVYPLVTSLGVDGLWFGVFLVILMELSLLTPPVGLNLFVIKDVAKAPFSVVLRGAMPYWYILLLMLVILAVFPQLVTWLPGQVF